jgi:cytochrome c5
MSNMTDRDFVKNFSLMIGSLIVLAVVLFIIAQIIGGKPEATKTSANEKDVIARIEPVGKLTVAQAVASTVIPGAQAADGAAVYNEACMACHASGAAGAPKLGDKAAWAPRIAKGNDALYTIALKGKGAMPPKGGRADKSDADIKAAVDYMVSKSK